ncbi:MAG: B12-binding domain-containing radical SAM protein, partial [Nitrospirales bacterium]|nr:B12-binding domain-containing radical SAM protein [Nitrospirales bacterium]
MSHLGLQIIYQMLNKEENIYCERVFAPWVDMEKELRENNVPLFSLETKTSLKDFDFLGFTLQYEMSYSNILNMMNMAGITLFSRDRKEDEPIIILGGPCAYNPEPMADFADIILIGEGEEAIIELMELYEESKQEKLSKKEFLLKAAQIWGIYVPSFYEVQYKEDGTLKSFKPLIEGVPEKITGQILDSAGNVYAIIETAHDGMGKFFLDADETIKYYALCS